jgi:hypothetical protein
MQYLSRIPRTTLSLKVEDDSTAHFCSISSPKIIEIGTKKGTLMLKSFWGERWSVRSSLLISIKRNKDDVSE